MKFKKWMKCIDPIVDVIIWTQDDDEEPAFEGSLLDMPWYYMDFQISRADGDCEEPIYISEHTNKYGNKMPCVVVNLIAE